MCKANCKNNLVPVVLTLYSGTPQVVVMMNEGLSKAKIEG